MAGAPATADLLALPPASAHIPNMFANLAPGTAPRRTERSDTTSSAVLGRQHLMVGLAAVVEASSLQMRAPFDAGDGAEDQALVESLESEGQQLPVILTRLPDRQPAQFRILDGHRRIAALRHLGRSHVEAVVIRQGTEDGDLLTLTANVRRNLTPMELADAIGRLEARGLSHTDIARRVGLTRTSVDSLGCLSRLSDPLQQRVRDGRLGVIAGAEFSKVAPEHQAALADLVDAGRVTVQQAQVIVDALRSGCSVAEAAAAAGCDGAAGAAAASAAEADTTPATGARAARKARKPKGNRILDAAGANDLLRGYFPDLEGRATRSLAETAARRRTRERELKIAGCFAATGLGAAEALDRARAVAGRLWTAKVVTMLDRIAELEALCTGDGCPPEAAQVLPALCRRMSAIRVQRRPGGAPAKASRGPA